MPDRDAPPPSPSRPPHHPSFHRRYASLDVGFGNRRQCGHKRFYLQAHIHTMYKHRLLGPLRSPERVPTYLGYQYGG